MPGGQLKFCVIWDETSKLFWATTNIVVDGQGAFDWFRNGEKRGDVRYASGLGGNDRRFLMLQYGVDGLNWFQAGCVAQGGKNLSIIVMRGLSSMGRPGDIARSASVLPTNTNVLIMRPFIASRTSAASR